jgi:hypothetical protein
VAVSRFTKSALLRSVLGMYAQRGRVIADVAVSRRLQEQNPALEGLNQQQAQAIAQQANRIYTAGRRLQNRSVNPLQRDEIPIDPSIGENDPRYRYRLLLEVYEGGERRGATTIEVDSDTILTRAQLQAIGNERLGARDTPGRPTMQQILSGTTGGVPIITVVTAGRRG